MPGSWCISLVPARHRTQPRRFTNERAKPRSSFRGNLRILWEVLFRKSKHSVPRVAMPVVPITTAQLQAAPNGSIYRLGHSSVLLKLRDKFWLPTQYLPSVRPPLIGWAPSVFTHRP